MDSVRDEGDAAVSRWTSKFDKVDVDSVCCPIEVRDPPSVIQRDAEDDIRLSHLIACHVMTPVDFLWYCPLALTDMVPCYKLSDVA